MYIVHNKTGRYMLPSSGIKTQLIVITGPLKLDKRCQTRGKFSRVLKFGFVFRYTDSKSSAAQEDARY